MYLKVYFSKKDEIFSLDISVCILCEIYVKCHVFRLSYNQKLILAIVYKNWELLGKLFFQAFYWVISSNYEYIEHKGGYYFYQIKLC